MLKLKEEHEMFANYYIALSNATEAYSRVYPAANRKTCCRNGHKLLQRDDVKAYIQEHAEFPTVSQSIADRDEILETLTDFLRNESIDIKDRMKSAELLGKSIALWTDKVEQKTETTITVSLEE